MHLNLKNQIKKTQNHTRQSSHPRQKEIWGLPVTSTATILVNCINKKIRPINQITNFKFRNLFSTLFFFFFYRNTINIYKLIWYPLPLCNRCKWNSSTKNGNIPWHQMQKETGEKRPRRNSFNVVFWLRHISSEFINVSSVSSTHNLLKNTHNQQHHLHEEDRCILRGPPTFL